MARRIARAGEKREFLSDLRVKKRELMDRMHKLTREMEALQHEREVRDARSPRHSRHRREVHRHFQSVNRTSFPKLSKKQHQLKKLQHAKKGTFASQHAAEMWRHRASMLRR